FQAEDGIRDFHVTGVQTCALPILEADGVTVPRDAFGHVKLDSVNPGAYFAKEFAAKIGAEKVLVQKSGYFSRAAASNEEDLRLRSEERRVGRECETRWSQWS